MGDTPKCDATERGTEMKKRETNLGQRIIYALPKIVLATVLVVIGLLTPALDASADPSTSWRGEYYNNINMSGSPALVRDDANVDFDWGDGAPASEVNADRFSVRWTSFVNFGAGDYTFYAQVDDGVRVWVDGDLLIDQWHDTPVTTHSATKYLSAGYHNLRVEYYENVGKAVCKVWWQAGGATPIHEWRGEYHDNTRLGGSPAVVRNDSAINFDWGDGSPAAGVGSDHFSVRWTRDVHFDTSGTRTFSATVDDGVRVWVDDSLIIDKWYPQSRTTHTASKHLSAGTHEIKVEYFEQTGVAVCKLSWSGAPTPSPDPQTIVVDNRDSNFVWGGPASSWYGRSTGYRGHLYWTWNSRAKAYNWARWYPHISTAGNWEAFVYIPSRYHGSKSARYKIYHNGVWNERVVNQNIYYDKWVSLGTYYFAGGPNEYVLLGDATGETYATRFVGFDAVKFVRQDGGAPPSPPSDCDITPVLGFGNVWNSHSAVRSKLGCPTETEKSVWAGEQSFQGGYMFWREDTKQIYVIYNNGTWQVYEDTWTTSQPETDPSIVAPSGYYQPKRGFGKVWRENPQVRNNLGWATTEERALHGSVQPFEGGRMIWSNTRGVYVLYSDSTWQRY